ncbi:hypothetical protein [Desulfuribacillus alkaliarsenatis]|uniref:Uncharacterized protein n=1 Tax=Desulfuribacillus alkaliarsenatis TaxID=766136 RepID=A0A1E5G564_9FIRM|nr:hypothetical protein [Desulfuribacillus alkaliarsenatis]OEF98320.1 hypothetical protein BHF68_01170 [Desulfuribacillus alkaliarsenatis]
MGYYYGIYVTTIIITYLLLHGRLKILSQPLGQYTFWSAALVGLFAPQILSVIDIVTASIIYIGLAIIAAVALNEYSKKGQAKPEIAQSESAPKAPPEPVAIQSAEATSEPAVEAAESVSEVSSEPVAEHATIVSSEPEVEVSTEPEVPAALAPDATVELTASEMFVAFDELIQEKSLRRYDKAIAIAKKLQKTTSLPNHMRQMVTFELADLYLELPDYGLALEQLEQVYKIGEPSKDVLHETDLRIEKIKIVKKLLVKNKKVELPWSSIPRLIQMQADDEINNNQKII